MNPQRVLVAFSSRSGSTAGTAEEIARVLRAAGLLVDCRAKEDVADVTPYRAVVVGSGMFVLGRASDGGGFIARHRAALRDRDVWLYSTGPIGARADGDGETAAASVARAIGARGAASFGIGEPGRGGDPVAAPRPAAHGEVRSWAAGIAASLGVPAGPRVTGRHRCHGAVAAH